MDRIKELQRLDERVRRITEFRAMPRDEEENKGSLARNVAIGAGAGAAATGAVVGANALGKRVQNRVGGLRATVPGFTQRSRVGQVAGAAGSLAEDAATAGKAGLQRIADKRILGNTVRKTGAFVRGKGLRSVGKAIGKFGKLIPFEAVEELRELDARLGKIIEFRKQDREKGGYNGLVIDREWDPQSGAVYDRARLTPAPGKKAHLKRNAVGYTGAAAGAAAGVGASHLINKGLSKVAPSIKLNGKGAALLAATGALALGARGMRADDRRSDRQAYNRLRKGKKISSVRIPGYETSARDTFGPTVVGIDNKLDAHFDQRRKKK